MPSKLWPCRCRVCNARRSLKRHPEEYKIPPACKKCGAREHKLRKHYEERGGIPPRLLGKCLTWAVDTYRKKSRVRDAHPMGTCHLDCYHYPHSRTSKNCRQRDEALLERSLKSSSKPEKLESPEAPF